MPAKPFPIENLVIFGVGLIGGSFALALKEACAVRRVIGLGRNPANLKRALKLGVIDAMSNDPAAVAGADLVLIATPVGQMGGVMRSIAPHLGARTVVTDGGSTKQDVVALAYKKFGKRVAQFVPGHPIAGAEASGLRVEDDLSHGRAVYRGHGHLRQCDWDEHHHPPASEYHRLGRALRHIDRINFLQRHQRRYRILDRLRHQHHHHGGGGHAPFCHHREPRDQQGLCGE